MIYNLKLFIQKVEFYLLEKKLFDPYINHTIIPLFRQLESREITTRRSKNASMLGSFHYSFVSRFNLVLGQEPT